MDIGVAVGLTLLVLFVWGIPMIFVLTDPIIGNKEKAIWLFAIYLASWLGWFLYQYAAPILPRPDVYDLGNDTTKKKIPPTF